MEVILTATDDGLAEAWEQHCGVLPGVRVHRGSILELECDAVVSPANSFGFMDGGIDRLYIQHFGVHIQERLQAAIQTRHHGELLVGAAEMVETDDRRIAYLIAAPTMRVPIVLKNSVNPCLAARAVFLLVLHGTLPAGRPVRETIQSVALPGLGIGVGQVGPQTCAHQVRAAIEDTLLEKSMPPRTWAEASERHQLLYASRPRRLQH